MKASIYNTVLLAGLAAAAPAPLMKRADIDGTILNYALTLEHLESAFYQMGVSSFTREDFANAGFNGRIFYQNFMEVAADEQTHVSFLTTALKAAGVTPVEACTYDFGDISTPEAFMQTASILEGVGVSAYLGAAALITNPDYLTAAGSILTIESRHDAFFRGQIGRSPFPQPFDIPLDFDQVYSMASAFIKSCPSTNPTLPVKAFPTLTLASTAPYIYQGDSISFTVAAGTTIPSDVWVAYPFVTGPVFEKATVSGQTVTANVPATGITGPSGEVYAILTSSGTTLTDDNTVAGPANINVIAPYLR